MNALSLKARFRLSRFVAGEKAGDEPVMLNHRRIFILPTQQGLGVVVLILLLLLIAFVYNNNLAYLLTFFLASIFFITILHTYQSLSGLILQPGHSKTVFAGEAAGFDIVINNPGPIERYHLKIALENAEHLTLAAHSKTVVSLYSMTRIRGWHEAGTITVSCTFPLGLFRAWSPMRFNLKALVYPKPSVLELPFPETPASQSLQGFSQKGADDFYGFQTYQPGDSIKHIHWKAFAKGQGLLSKHYGGENAVEIWLNYDSTPGHQIEERLSQLCRWVIDAEKAGIVYGFSLPGFSLPPDNGALHAKKCLEALALF